MLAAIPEEVNSERSSLLTSRSEEVKATLAEVD